MKMLTTLRTSTYVLATILFSACVTTNQYDFRSPERPAYHQAINVEELEELRVNSDVTVLDVRLLEDYRANEVLIPDAEYMNPDNIQTWASTLPQNGKVVVYCVAGKWVSQKAAHYLSQQGIETYTLEGGLESWQASQ